MLLAFYHYYFTVCSSTRLLGHGVCAARELCLNEIFMVICASKKRERERERTAWTDTQTILAMYLHSKWDALSKKILKIDVRPIVYWWKSLSVNNLLEAISAVRGCALPALISWLPAYRYCHLNFSCR